MCVCLSKRIKKQNFFSMFVCSRNKYWKKNSNMGKNQSKWGKKQMFLFLSINSIRFIARNEKMNKKNWWGIFIEKNKHWRIKFKHTHGPHMSLIDDCFGGEYKNTNIFECNSFALMIFFIIISNDDRLIFLSNEWMRNKSNNNAFIVYFAPSQQNLFIVIECFFGAWLF